MRWGGVLYSFHLLRVGRHAGFGEGVSEEVQAGLVKGALVLNCLESGYGPVGGLALHAEFCRGVRGCRHGR